jgi:hypothetical protein
MDVKIIEWTITGGDLDGIEGVEEEMYPGQHALQPWWAAVGQLLNSYTLHDLEELEQYVEACGGEFTYVESERTFDG